MDGVEVDNELISVDMTDEEKNMRFEPKSAGLMIEGKLKKLQTRGGEISVGRLMS